MYMYNTYQTIVTDAWHAYTSIADNCPNTWQATFTILLLVQLAKALHLTLSDDDLLSGILFYT